MSLGRFPYLPEGSRPANLMVCVCVCVSTASNLILGWAVFFISTLAIRTCMLSHAAHPTHTHIPHTPHTPHYTHSRLSCFSVLWTRSLHLCHLTGSLQSSSTSPLNGKSSHSSYIWYNNIPQSFHSMQKLPKARTAIDALLVSLILLVKLLRLWANTVPLKLHSSTHNQKYSNLKSRLSCRYRSTSIYLIPLL